MLPFNRHNNHTDWRAPQSPGLLAPSTIGPSLECSGRGDSQPILPAQNGQQEGKHSRHESIPQPEKQELPRLPSLRSILNPPPSSTTIPLQPSHRNAEGPKGTTQRQASPLFFPNGLPSPVIHRPDNQVRPEISAHLATSALPPPTTPAWTNDSFPTSSRTYPPSEYASSLDGTSPQVLNGPHLHKAASVGSNLTIQSSDRAVSVSSFPSHEDLVDTPRVPLKRRAEPTQRAPKVARCLGQRHVPGEGVCFVYDDGSYCKTMIDGERVNPAWGITKAGKPRKRLAQACLTCREKKIKCEPAYPKCHQCAKSQRQCRGGLTQQAAMSNSARTDESVSVLPSGAGAEASSPIEKGSSEQSAVTSHQTSTIEAGDSPISTSISLKRRRSASPMVAKQYYDEPCTDGDSLLTPTSEPFLTGRIVSHHPDDPLTLGWDRDPYQADPKLALKLIDLYFRHIHSATYCIFPRTKFVNWVKQDNTKSQDDRMLLYCILALGSVFTDDPKIRALGKQLADIGAHALERRFGKFTLQLCHSRLVLGMYFFARGKSTEAWDYSGTACRAISALRLNTEDGVADFDDMNPEYGFDRTTLEECRRRTFWSGFLMDRYNGFCGGTNCIFQPDDVFVRLPSSKQYYDQLSPPPSTAPCFERMYSSLLTPDKDMEPFSRKLSPMAYLVLVSTIWGDVFSTGARAVHRGACPAYYSTYETFYDTTTRRLQAWLSNLPSHLRYSVENLDNAIRNGHAGTYLSLHAIYHTASIRLNRHVRITRLTPDVIQRNIAESYKHAYAILDMMQDLSKTKRQARYAPSDPATNFVFSTPFPGYAYMTALDVVSAGGLLSNITPIIEKSTSGYSCVEEIAGFWASAKAQNKSCRTRLKQLGDVGMSEIAGSSKKEEQQYPGCTVRIVGNPGGGGRAGSWGKFWRMDTALENSFDKKDDLIYGTDLDTFFTATKEAAVRARGNGA